MLNDDCIDGFDDGDFFLIKTFEAGFTHIHIHWALSPLQ